jgi:hypothetical protein
MLSLSAYAKTQGQAMAENEAADFNEGLSRRVDIELFIVHPTMSPVEITSALGLEARFAHRAGDLRKTPKGTSLKGTYPDTRWRHYIRHELTDQWFVSNLTALIDSLAPHKAFLHRVRDTGGRAQIIVQFLGDGYLGDTVSLQTLKKMTELQLDFGIECYAVPQS